MDKKITNTPIFCYLIYIFFCERCYLIYISRFTFAKLIDMHQVFTNALKTFHHIGFCGLFIYINISGHILPIFCICIHS